VRARQDVPTSSASSATTLKTKRQLPSIPKEGGDEEAPVGTEGSFCPHCGKDLGFRFCPFCGKPLPHV